jgi:hypothetical protein
MSKIKSVLKDNISDIVKDLNEELLLERIFRYWNKHGSHMTLREYVNTYWPGNLNEFAVDLGVSFGKIFELYIPFKLQELGYNIEPKYTSSGDMMEHLDDSYRLYWELKTGRGKFIQGATHSPKEKKMFGGLLQVLWEGDWDTSLDTILETRKFISHLNICVFRDTKVDSVGEYSNNNSRTTLQFTRDKYNECKDACIFGSIKKNRVCVRFVKESVASLYSPLGM